MRHRMQGYGVYLSFDFGGIWQIPVGGDPMHTTTFHTFARGVEYKCVSFRLVNAPTCLQRQVNHDLLRVINKECMVLCKGEAFAFSLKAQGRLL